MAISAEWWRGMCLAPDTDTGSAARADDDDTRDVGGESSSKSDIKSGLKHKSEDDSEEELDDDDTDKDADTDSEEDSAPQSSELIAYLRQQGLQVEDSADDEAVLKGLLGRVSQAEQERQQYAAAQQQYQWQLQQQQVQQNWLMQQQFAAQQQQQAAVQKQRQLQGMLSHWNQVPEYNEQWLQFITTDEHGNPVVKPGGDPNLLQKVEQRRAWERQGMQQMLQNPLDFVGHAVFQNPVFHNYVQQVASQQVAAVRQEMEYERQVRTSEKLLTEIEPLMVESDASGQRKLTQFGQAYGQAVQELAGVIGDPNELHRQAVKRAYPYLPTNGKAAAQPGTQSKANGEAKRFNILRAAATRNAGRGGTVRNGNSRKPAQDRELPIEERLRREFEAAGIQDSDIK